MAATAVLAWGCNPLGQAELDGGGDASTGSTGSTGSAGPTSGTGASGSNADGATTSGASASSGMVTTAGSSTSSSDSGSTTSDTSAVADESSSSGTTGEPQPVELIYTPTVTACIALDNPDPDECALQTDPGYFQCDGDEPALGGSVVRAYLHFDGLDLDGVTVQTVTLRMLAHPGDPGSSSGAIWAVEPFTYAGLFGSVPAQVGPTPLADPPGLVPQELWVEWSLPPSAVEDATDVYLGLVTASNDGVDYNDETTAQPPELIVTGLQ